MLYTSLIVLVHHVWFLFIKHSNYIFQNLETLRILGPTIIDFVYIYIYIYTVFSRKVKINNKLLQFSLNISSHNSGLLRASRSLLIWTHPECCFERKAYFFNIYLFVSCCAETCAPPLDTFWPWPLPGGAGWTSFLWRPTKVLSWDANVARIWVHKVNRAVHTVCSLESRICSWARIQQHLIINITFTSLDLYWGLELLIMWDWRWWYHNLQIGRCPCCWQLQLI